MRNARNASSAARLPSSDRERSIFNTSLFMSPYPAGRVITAGFSWMQKIGKSASIDMWFPQKLRDELDKLVQSGGTVGPEHFPAGWAAVRQFELLQEAGNYKVYNMQADYLARSLQELTRNMRGGGYRVTVVTLGSYSDDFAQDELAILDQHLQDRLSKIIHMLYLEEHSGEANAAHHTDLNEGRWNYRSALPHVGMTLGARDLFRPLDGGVRSAKLIVTVPHAPFCVTIDGWAGNLGVTDAASGRPLAYVAEPTKVDEYAFVNGVYTFSRADEGRDVQILYMKTPSAEDRQRKLTVTEKKHRLARSFFDVLEMLPHKHIVHDTAIGLQLPEMINENEWLYVPETDETLHAFNMVLRDAFAPFDFISMSALAGRIDAKPEIKATVQHMQGYGDRLTPQAEEFQRRLAQFIL